MSYQSLYRTYRPRHFKDVVGQDAIKTALQNAIIKDQKAHAYLFCGPRGTGKTSVAKIFAQAINCLNPNEAPCGVCDVCAQFDINNHPDIIEIDAASNNGVDEIRDLIEKVKYAPIELTYKVYIIDEVHMLSQGAFNALLKTLEEPPSHVVFILATTEVHKVIGTILSRCQRYDFTRVSTDDIVKRLEVVFENEKITVESEALQLIATLADGGMRDALTIAEQVIVFSDDTVTLDNVQKVYKVISPKQKKDFIDAILLKDLDAVMKFLKVFETESIEYQRLIGDLMSFVKEITVYMLTNNKEHISPFHRDEAKELSERYAQNELLNILSSLVKVSQDASFNGRYQDYLELAVLKLCIDGAVKIEEPTNKQETPTVAPKQVEEPLINPSPKTTVEKTTQTNTSPTYNQTEIIEFMVLGDKELKNHELTLWPRMREYATDVRYRKVSPYLGKSTLAISGDDFVVLVVEREEEAHHLNNDPSLVSETIGVVLGKPKQATTITVEQFNETVEVFKKLAKNKQLPDISVLKEKRKASEAVETDSEPSTQDQLTEFFGEHLSIIE